MDETNQSAQMPATPGQGSTTPPANPQPPQQPATTPQPMAQPKKSKTPLIAGLIVAALLVAGAIAYGVYAYITNQPDYLLNKSIEQLGRETAVAAKFKITTGTEANGTTFSGDFAARGDSATKDGEAVIGVGSGDSRVTVNTRIIDETMFLRFGDLDNLGNLMKSLAPGQEGVLDSPEFKQALAGVSDRWFELTKEELANVMQSSGATGATGFKAEDYQRLAEIYNKHQFFRADQSFADEAVEGVNTAHFSIKVDKPTLKAFLKDLKAANLESFTVTDQDINDSDKIADEFSKDIAVEAWVARDSQKLKQIKFVSKEAGSEGSMVLTFVTNLPQFEKLEKPADTTPFSEFMTLLLGPIYSSSLEESEFESVE